MMQLSKVLFLVLFAAAACTSKSKETVKATEAGTLATDSSGTIYALDFAASTLSWEGYEGIALLDSEHNGTINLTEGRLETSAGMLSGGAFTIDMNSIAILDIPVEKPGHAKLLRHLKNEDFFDVSRFPTARFEITSVRPGTADSLAVTGNLTIKEVSKSITIPATVSISDSVVTASARFFINRKDWGIVYRIEESLGDKMIRPEIGFSVSLSAKR